MAMKISNEMDPNAPEPKSKPKPRTKAIFIVVSSLERVSAYQALPKIHPDNNGDKEIWPRILSL